MTSREIIEREISKLETSIQLALGCTPAININIELCQQKLSDLKQLKQELDRLETLEKENQGVKDDNTRLWHGLECANNENAKLKQENQELKENYESLKKDYWELDKVEEGILEKFLVQGQVISAIQDEIVKKIETETIYKDVSPMCEVTISINKKIFDMLFEKKEVFESVGEE